MGTLFSYSLYSSILLSLLYLSYKWVLAGENQHSFNRVALWGIYVVSLLALPVTSFVSGLTVPEPVAVPEIEIGEIMMTVIDDDSADLPVGQPLYLTLLLWVYAAGMAVAVGQTLWIALRLSRIISRRDWDESGEMILTHELQHLGLRHWIDLLVAQLIGIFQWYNPAAWLMREELKTVHEYQADRAVINSGVGVRDYQMLLIKKAVGARFPSLANSLNHSKLKKRITMMYNQNSSATRRLRALALVPALGIAVAVTNLDAVASVISDTASAVIVESADETLTDNTAITDEINVVAYKNTEISPDEQMAQSESELPAVAEPATEAEMNIAGEARDDEKVYSTVEKKPEFPGGDSELMKYVSANIRYPENAFKNKIQGRVIVKFVVQKDGKVGDVTILRGADKELDDEAVRVIRSLPAFTPGEMDGKPVAVWYTIPVMFKVTGESSVVKPEGASAGNSSAASDRNSAAAPASTDPNMVYTVVEKKPQFPGGDVELLKYVSENIRYPLDARNKKEQGRVIVQFVVSKDGSIGDVKVIRKVSDELDNEAIRVIKSLPAFTPGEMAGKPVAVWYTLPVSFKLTNKSDAPAEKTDGVTVMAEGQKDTSWTDGLRIIGTGTTTSKGDLLKTVKVTEKLILNDSIRVMLDGERYYGKIDDIDVNRIKSITVDKRKNDFTHLFIETKSRTSEERRI